MFCQYRGAFGGALDSIVVVAIIDTMHIVVNMRVFNMLLRLQMFIEYCDRGAHVSIIAVVVVIVAVLLNMMLLLPFLLWQSSSV